MFFFLGIGVCTASIALFSELDIIIELINMGTSHTPPLYIPISLSWKFNQQMWGLPLFGELMITITAFYNHKVPHAHAQHPLIKSYWRKKTKEDLCSWGSFVTLFYVLYGVHSTFQAKEEIKMGANKLNSSSSNLQTDKVEEDRVL
ncbi:hypothetical protein CR513_32049, partial [Mucuna pruriens]